MGRIEQEPGPGEARAVRLLNLIEFLFEHCADLFAPCLKPPQLRAISARSWALFNSWTYL
jgi:hypothetical protein